MKSLHATLLLLSVAVLSAFTTPAVPPGEVVGWGANVAGEATGISSFALSEDRMTATGSQWATGAVVVAGHVLKDVVAIAADDGFSLALRLDGTVVGWGDNQVGRATGTGTPFPYRSSGSVMVGGRALSNVVSIAAGSSFGLALKRDGRLVAWGKNEVPAGLSNVVAIAARGFYSVALRKDGTVASWASMPPGQSRVPAGLSNVVAVACGGEGYERSMALKKDGTVVVWKAGTPSEEDVPPEVRDAVAIAAGGSHSLALKRDGTVFGWGFNADGQATGVPTETPPDAVGFNSGIVTIGGRVLSNVVAIAAAGPYSLALKRTGEVAAWGDKRFCRGVPAGLTNVVAIAAGRGYCLAITTNPAPFTSKR
jgi:alpha-tubulin suppressor-like RCC1 family protein